MDEDNPPQIRRFRVEEKDDPWDLPDFVVTSTPWKGEPCHFPSPKIERNSKLER